MWLLSPLLADKNRPLNVAHTRVQEMDDALRRKPEINPISTISSTTNILKRSALASDNVEESFDPASPSASTPTSTAPKQKVTQKMLLIKFKCCHYWSLGESWERAVTIERASKNDLNKGWLMVAVLAERVILTLEHGKLLGYVQNR